MNIIKVFKVPIFISIFILVFLGQGKAFEDQGNKYINWLW
jgi:hypothetical protein